MMTWEQQRASDAWKKSEKYGKKARNFTKGLPALIMNSGLMQTLAFCEEDSEYKEVAKDLRDWLGKWLVESGIATTSRKDFNDDFEEFMDYLFHVESGVYRMITDEALAWLKWLRQLAAARS